MNCEYCNGVIESGRLEIGLTYCKACALRGCGNQDKKRGVMIYSHKTAPTIQIMSSGAFNEYRRNNPLGRNTGRGSGLHRVTRTTSSI